MNTATIGTLSSRYARALYAYALDNNEEEKVYDEMKYLSHGFLSVPELKKFLQNPILPLETKLKVLETAAGGNAAKCSAHFYEFLFGREKEDLLLYIATAYLSVYRKAKHVVFVDLTVAAEPENDFVEKIKNHVLKEYDENTVVEMSINSDPDIIGGFILNVDGKQLDLSVKGELNNIRKLILKKM
ncbi:MAG: F0F1 ATP synthase subunit delta [Prevotellaceae bacterium]|jgi:F-type H+-transporting ATPase subunit delta|nr:F0F1 ATP synthase subunit delta [Prevotellaceae bacterium]